MKTIWNKGKKTEADHIISELLKVKLADGRWIANFQNELYFRALESLANIRLARVDVLKTLGEMVKRDLTGDEGFEIALNSVQRDSWKQNQEWTAHFPWYVQLKEQIKLPFTITVCKTTFRISKWISYERKILNADLEQNAEADAKRAMFSGLCITAKIMGRNYYEAWENLAPSVGAFRGIVELTYNLGKHNWSIPPKPKCAVPHHLWVALFPEKGQAELLNFTVDTSGIKEKEITIKRMIALQKNAKFFRKLAVEEGTIDSLLLNSVRLYTGAVDERLDHNALLAWWQLAEAITLSSRFNGDTKTVAKRLSWYCHKWKLDITGINACLEKIGEHRNEIVHRGFVQYVDEDDCNFMKTVCERAILWLANNRNRLKSLDVLERVYQFSSQDSNGLDDIKTALKLIR